MAAQIALKSQHMDELDWLAARYYQLGLNRLFSFGDYAADPLRAEEVADRLDRIRRRRVVRLSSNGHNPTITTGRI